MKNLYNIISYYKDLIFNKYYPLSVLNRIRSRKRNNNVDFTLMVGNCMGGYIYHQLGVKFKSPTINLMIYDDDFYKMVSNLDYYLKQEFVAYKDPEYPNIPTAKLADIVIHFTHYNSVEEGVLVWKRRQLRINLDNLYIIAADMRLTERQIADYGKVKCKKIVVFTSKKYDYPWCLHVKRFNGQEKMGPYINKTLSGKWLFEEFFDYVGWLNSDDPIAQHFSLEK